MATTIWHMRQAQAMAVAANLHMIGAPIMADEVTELANEIQRMTGCGTDQALDAATAMQPELAAYADEWNELASQAWLATMEEQYRGR